MFHVVYDPDVTKADIDARMKKMRYRQSAYACMIAM
jgi:hypothetical protein